MKRERNRKYSKNCQGQNETKILEKYFKVNSKRNNIEEKLQKKQEIKRQNNKQYLITSWLYKDVNKSNNNNIWMQIDKPVVLIMFQYMTLSQISNLARVCQYFHRCYQSVWLNFDYFSHFNVDMFNSAELRMIMQKSTRLGHILMMKKLFSGKNLQSMRDRLQLKAIASPQKGIFQTFEIEPKKTNSNLFIMDQNVIQICSRSYLTLHTICLKNCPFLTSKCFIHISKCRNLKNLTITKNSFINDSDIQILSKNCTKLNTINIQGCRNLTAAIFKFLGELPKLEYINLSQFYHHMNNINLLYKLSIKLLSLSASNISNGELLSLLKYDKIQALNINNCYNLNAGIVKEMNNLKLKNLLVLNLRRLQTTQSELYQLILDSGIKDVSIQNQLLSQRINIILNERNTNEAKRKADIFFSGLYSHE